MSDSSSDPRDVTRYRQFLKNGMPGAHAYAILLGLEYFDLPSVLKAVEKGLPWKAFDRIVENTGIGSEQLASMIGIPKRTLARRKVERRFHPDESDRLLRVARVYGKTLRLFDGDRHAATVWLTNIQRALGRVPLELVRSEVGAREVENVIGAIENGMFL